MCSQVQKEDCETLFVLLVPITWSQANWASVKWTTNQENRVRFLDRTETFMIVRINICFLPLTAAIICAVICSLYCLRCELKVQSYQVTTKHANLDINMSSIYFVAKLTIIFSLHLSYLYPVWDDFSFLGQWIEQQWAWWELGHVPDSQN